MIRMVYTWERRFADLPLERRAPLQPPAFTALAAHPAAPERADQRAGKTSRAK